MSVLDWFSSLFQKNAQHYVCVTIPPARQDPPMLEVALQAEKHYLRLWLAEMFLKDDRRLFRDFVPVVHSTVRLQFADKPAQELPYVAGPQNLNLGSTLGQGVQLDHFLTNLLPYRGGTVSIAAGLVAYKSKDLFQGFSEVLHDVTGILNVGQLSAALKVADAAVDGIQNLLGAGDKDVHLLYFQGFGGATGTGGATLKSGYTAVINANAKAFPVDKLFVKQSRLCFGSDLAAATPLDGYDYMLLRTEAGDTRDDFTSFEVFASLLESAVTEGQRDRTAGLAIIQTAMTLAWKSPDLTIADRIRVAKAMKDLYESTVPPVQPPAPLNLAALTERFNAGVLAVDPAGASAAADVIVARAGGLDSFIDAVSAPI